MQGDVTQYHPCGVCNLYVYLPFISVSNYYEYECIFQLWFQTHISQSWRIGPNIAIFIQTKFTWKTWNQGTCLIVSRLTHCIFSTFLIWKYLCRFLYLHLVEFPNSTCLLQHLKPCRSVRQTSRFSCTHHTTFFRWREGRVNNALVSSA